MSAIFYQSRDGIAEITINRPENYNILTHEAVAGLREAWVRFNESSDHVAILTGAGDKAFTAGVACLQRTRQLQPPFLKDIR